MFSPNQAITIPIYNRSAQSISWETRSATVPAHMGETSLDLAHASWERQIVNTQVISIDGVNDHDLFLGDCAYATAQQHNQSFSYILRNVRKPSFRAIDVHQCGKELETKLNFPSLPNNVDRMTDRMTETITSSIHE